MLGFPAFANHYNAAMTLPDLTPDCRNCDALCCVLLGFDRSGSFAYTKPACTACRNLDAANLCRIHPDLADKGFNGCIRFDCHGAGQVITAMFKGRSWRDDPGQMPAMDQAFRLQRRLHEALVLLEQSAQLPLTAAQDATRQTLLAALQSPNPITALTQTAQFFASLRALTAPRR